MLNAAGGGRMPCDHRPAAPPAASEPSEASAGRARLRCVGEWRASVVRRIAIARA